MTIKPKPLYVTPISAELMESVRQLRFIAFDFDGVITDNSVYVFEDGREAACCSRFDSMGLEELRKLGIEMCVISKEVNPVVGARCTKLGLPYVQGCDEKQGVLLEMLEERGLQLEQAAFVGNDINDISCLEVVGLPIVVQDSHPDVIPYGRYRTRLLGGRGAVREVCDLVVSVINKQ